MNGTNIPCMSLTCGKDLVANLIDSLENQVWKSKSIRGNTLVETLLLMEYSRDLTMHDASTVLNTSSHLACQ